MHVEPGNAAHRAEAILRDHTFTEPRLGALGLFDPRADFGIERRGHGGQQSGDEVTGEGISENESTITIARQSSLTNSAQDRSLS